MGEGGGATGHRLSWATTATARGDVQAPVPSRAAVPTVPRPSSSYGWLMAAGTGTEQPRLPISTWQNLQSWAQQWWPKFPPSTASPVRGLPWKDAGSPAGQHRGQGLVSAVPPHPWRSRTYWEEGMTPEEPTTQLTRPPSQPSVGQLRRPKLVDTQPLGTLPHRPPGSHETTWSQGHGSEPGTSLLPLAGSRSGCLLHEPSFLCPCPRGPPGKDASQSHLRSPRTLFWERALPK